MTRYDHDRPKEQVYWVLASNNEWQSLTFRKKRGKWHLVSSSATVSYSQKELDEFCRLGIFVKRS